MNIMHLTNIDLNLIVSLDALLQERNVTRAAQRVGISQSAMSHGLARLRTLFDDPILVRSGRKMVLTPRAEQLVSPLAEALQNLAGALQTQRPFVPLETTGVVSIACGDYISSLLVPSLVRRLSREAPHLDMDLAPMGHTLHERLESGEVTLAIGVLRGRASGLRRRLLFTENFASVVRQGHPSISKRLTLKKFCETPHILVGTGIRGEGAVDAELAKIDKSRRVAVRTATFLSAPLIVAETDLILTIPLRLAHRFAKVFALQVYKPPVVLAGFQCHSQWHERWQNDARHRWFRRLVAEESDKIKPE
ncbi:MAG: LysR family transcriptional regulator [Deltaproteobacteria bacterium]|nr:LysR family transcriptional regulator [Deltaproteobacteria bacterium]